MNEPVSGLKSRKVFVVGANVLQNELITTALWQETGIPCFAVDDLTGAEHFHEGDEKSAGLALHDCLGRDGKVCLADLEKNWAGKNCMVALFNLDRSEEIEKQALSCGVRGFFYRGEPFSLLVKGVVGIFAGEYWISRHLLSQWVDQKGPPAGRMQQRVLSEPEKKILSLMAGGASNKEIGATLCMSPHTVKKHLQKIFRKIDTHNKTAAVLWAGRYLHV
jgi:DNA-binding NarL/FixJ family response regulator